MSTSLAVFRKQLASGELKPAYLIAGEEHLLVIEAADALRARARELGYVEREILDVEPHFDWNRLADAGRALSLFASRRLIDLRLPTGRPDKDGSAAIIAFCDAPPPDTVLLVTANDWSKRHEGAWVRAVESVGVFVPVWPMKREELPNWIGARMSQKGVAATSDAITWLAERVEGNLLAAAQEIDKLALTAQGRTIDVAMLEASVADDARYDVFRLTDAAIGGDAARALRILAGLRAEGEEVIPMLGWVLNQLRQLSSMAAEPGGSGGGYGREAAMRRALRNADPLHWDRCLAQAARVEIFAKGQNLDAAGRSWGDAWIEFERLIAAIAKPRAAKALLA
ncbi:MAG TPA: DNA polymerase III subunit delta [Rhodanobacteraceae bacterium]|jgi:DNA polymerase-3 subunit delta|nr:DNA polymerase III subunit delta [Rhodanobacteraceae bacterium]